MKLFLLICLMSFSYLTLFNGCSDKFKETPNKIVKKNKLEDNTISPNVSIITADQLQNIIKNRYGKILFINVWATWSEPSVKELPDIVQLYEKYKDNDVDFLSLSVNLTSKIDSVIIPFLKKEKIHFPVYVVQEKSGLKIMKILSPKWNGGIPASFLFDRNGNRRIFILGRQTYSNFCKGIDSVQVLK